jgi:hypothetical protein
MRADPAITPWDTARWETPDIWIDNQINGYGTYEFIDGNRDRPEPNAENRVYFRIHNHGLASAQNVQAQVYVALPGAGDSNNRWQFLGSAYFASVPSRGAVESFVNWTPPMNHGGHGCVKVEILPLANELDMQNNAAQENIFEFESTRNSPWRVQSQPLEIWNPFDDRNLRVLMDVTNLPHGWAVELHPPSFVLPPAGMQRVMFKLHPAGSPQYPSTGYEEGGLYNVSVVAHGYTDEQTHVLIGGVTALTQLKHNVLLDVRQQAVDGSVVALQGCLKPAIASATVALAFTDPRGKRFIQRTHSDPQGCYRHTLRGYAGKWSVQALYDGTGRWGSARSTPLTFKLP